MKVTTICTLAIAITVAHAAIADVPSRTRQLYSRSMIEKRMGKTPEELQREEISRMVTEFTKLLVTQEANKQKAQQQQQQQQPQYYYVNNAPPPNYFPANPTATVHDNCGGVNPCPPPTLPPIPTSNCVSGSPCPTEPIPPAIQALLPPGAVPTTPGVIPGYFSGYPAYPLNTGLPTASTTKAKGEDEEDKEESEEKDQDDEKDDEEKKEEEKKDEDKDDEDEPEDDEGKLEKRQTINDASINAISSPPPAPDESESESQENGEDEA